MKNVIKAASQFFNDHGDMVQPLVHIGVGAAVLARYVKTRETKLLVSAVGSAVACGISTYGIIRERRNMAFALKVGKTINKANELSTFNEAVEQYGDQIVKVLATSSGLKVPVIVSDELAARLNNVLPSSGIGAFGFGWWDENKAIIVLNRKTANSKHIEAILGHELGHIELLHVTTQCNIPADEQEYQADDWAIERGYDMRKALSYVLNRAILEGYSFESIKEIRSRQRRL